MKWNSGQPSDKGFYLCAIIGNDRPYEMYWDGLSWSYFDDYKVYESVDKNDVAYYMNLSDIPMPENW